MKEMKQASKHVHVSKYVRTYVRMNRCKGTKEQQNARKGSRKGEGGGGRDEGKLR